MDILSGSVITDNEDFISSSTIFGCVQRTVLSKNFKGGGIINLFGSTELDLTQAESVADLIASNSAASHQTAMQQMRGGFSKELHVLREQLISFSALIELELDFSQEDVEFAERVQVIYESPHRRGSEWHRNSHAASLLR